MLVGWACPPPTQLLELFPSEIHVWRAKLALDAAELERLQKILSSDEQARAERFFFGKDRQRFIASRGILREILSRYVKREPARLEFTYSRFGKPSLASEISGDNIHFNLSHSNGLALYAVSRISQIGVDLEAVNRTVPCEQIAQYFFSPQDEARRLGGVLVPGLLQRLDSKRGAREGARERPYAASQRVQRKPYAWGTCRICSGAGGFRESFRLDPEGNCPRRGLHRCPRC